MLVIFVSGAPCTGRTTTTNTLRKYFEEYMPDLSIKVIDKEPRARVIVSDIVLAIYRNIIENAPDVMIIDGLALNYFDRKEIMNNIEAAKRINTTLEVEYLAINHDRNRSFTFLHNKDEGHVPYSSKNLREKLVNHQQPIPKEGFKYVYPIIREDMFDPIAFADVMNKYAHMVFKFVVPEVPEEDTETSDTTVANIDETEPAETEDVAE